MQKQTVAPAPVVISSVSADQSASGGVVKELYTKAVFPGNLVVLGCGTIGQGIIPMLLKHTDITPERMTIVAAHDAGREIAERFGVKFILETLTEENYKAVLRKYLSPQDFLLNLSVDVSSEDLIIWCQKHQVLYLDTSDELWPGF
ncbi:MAG: saccharopine dehydrogenase NADP-binding domain-containing protein, partial [Patescibacteria group bacterium]|nr:saccharopine dehydrogenase NADP-binding domain-containing protein [Patescibacteria group bacterium]